MQHLKETLAERMEQSLAREIGTAAQALQDGEPVPFDVWPQEQQAMALWAARYALRILDRRARRDAHLHATLALVRAKYGETTLAELTDLQIRRCYFEAKTVLDQFWGRMTDREFQYLNGDVRSALESAARVQ